MANLSDLQFNRNAEPAQDFSPLPMGEYLAQVVASEIKDTKSGTGKYVKLQWQVTDGQHAGRVIFANYNIINANPKAQEIGEREFAAACQGLGKVGVNDTEELHAIPCVIKLKIEPERNGYGPSNRITSYKVATGVQDAPPASPPAASQAAPPAAGMPWQS
jgi:hypothetical protein